MQQALELHPVIAINDLSFGYRRSPLFEHLDLALEPGNVYGLLGMNGAGKTTLLKLIVGLLFPQRGAVRTLGHEPKRREPGLLSRVFLLPEELNLPGVTDREYVSVRAPFYPGFNHAEFGRLIQELDVPTGRKLTALSHGQQKKFMLAFGLASGAALLVLDEPTNGLDIPSKGLFRRLVAGAMTDERIFIISTHQVQDVASLIDPIVIVHGGQVLFQRALSDVASRVRMAHGTTKPDANAPALLYSEPAVEGFRSLWLDDHAGDGHVDLELLFNFVVSQPERCRTLFGAASPARAGDRQ
jgi:ABC-2 type transport system ATP-binding protein